MVKKKTTKKPKAAKAKATGKKKAGKASPAKKPKKKTDKKPTKKTAKKPKTKTDERYFVTIKEACDHFKVPARSFHRRKNHPKYPKKKKQGYEYNAVKLFLQHAGMFSEKKILDKDQESAIKIRVQRERLEWDFQKEKNLLITREEHNRIVMDLTKLFVERLKELPERVAAKIRNKESVEIAESIVNQTLQRLAENIANG